MDDKKPRQVTFVDARLHRIRECLGTGIHRSNPRAHGICCNHYSSEPGFFGAGLATLRCWILPAGCYYRYRQWSRINATLYTMCFTRKALAIARCELCFASMHTTAECRLQGDTDPVLATRIKAIESAVLALIASQGKAGGLTRGSAEPCRLWNNNSIFSVV
jgi:hypothetical protein